MRLPLRPLIYAALFCSISLSLPAASQSLQAQAQQIAPAFDAADSGDTSAAPSLHAHPLYGWLEYAGMRRQIDSVSNQQATDFLSRYAGQAVADAFRASWLPALARRQDWSTLLANWAPTNSVSLSCSRLTALQASGKADATWIAEAQKIWSDGGKSLPDACDPVFATLQAKGGLTDAVRWARIDAAADAREAGIMRYVARGLPDAEQRHADDYAAYISAPDARPLAWPKNDRSRRIATDGLELLARNDPDTAEKLLPQIADALDMSAEQRGQVRYQIALWTVASYLPDSARRLAAVPAASYDERLHEWQVRDALSRGDWPAALAAIRRMPRAQRDDPQWQYFEARLAEKTGDKATAKALYAKAAQSPTFHGFLAADRLHQPYALCPWEPDDNAQTKASVARTPALVRAIELYDIGRYGWAVAEWKSALANFDDSQRRIAVEVAIDNGWFDRAVFGLGKTPDEYRLYRLRFPLHHDETIRRASAANAIDPAWVAAEIRAESVFNPMARSPANARGLMQVLPSTGAKMAADLGLAGYGGAASLYDPDTNITIGTAYLRKLMNDYDGLPYVTMAAYNAGPSPTARWLSQHPNYDPDFWIETVNYKETRDYIARVLAFSVIYDWRLNGDALPLSDRMVGRLTDTRKKFVCPQPASPPPAAATTSTR